MLSGDVGQGKLLPGSDIAAMSPPRRLRARNPRTGQQDYEFTVMSCNELAQSVAALRRAQRGWHDAGVAARIAALGRWQRELRTARHAIVDALALDTGRRRLASVELDGILSGIDRWCAAAPDLVRTQERPSAALPHVVIEQSTDPYPVVGAISPWNFPLLLSFIDAIPALLAGCAAFVKPSDVTPRFVVPLAASIAAVPKLDAVLRVAPGDGALGTMLIRHVDVVAFTGSVATGRKVAASAAEALIPAYLELGGKDAAIVLAGSDLERAATALLRASVAATGQACQSIERIYVHRDSFDALVSLLVAKSHEVVLSRDPDGGDIGPFIFARQAEIVAAQLADAVAKGARIHTGGEIELHGGGLWMSPTVVTNVDHGMQLMQEETFGPVMPVMAFDSVDEAVRLANDSAYGLSAAVFGPDESVTRAVARRLEAGGVSVNDAGLTTMLFETEKSAYRSSGVGPSRFGPSGLTRFLRRRSTYVNRGEVLPIQAYSEGTR